MKTIEISNLKKHFKTVKAVDGISMTVNEGEILGFIGPNGAGKTTTIGCMLGLLQPTDGAVTINGLDSWTQSAEIKRDLGYIPSDPYFYPTWRGKDYFEYFNTIKGKSELLLELVKDFDFNPKAVIKNLSTGNKQKLSIISAMMHSPKVLIMDEPTRGLDPLLQNVFYRYVQTLQKVGTTIFMSSHNLPEVESICTSVAVIKAGKLEEVGSIKDLHTKKVHIVKLTMKTTKTLTEKIVREFNGSIVTTINNTFEIKISGDLKPFLKQLPNLDIVDVNINSANLEELFLEFYK